MQPPYKNIVMLLTAKLRFLLHSLIKCITTDHALSKAANLSLRKDPPEKKRLYQYANMLMLFSCVSTVSLHMHMLFY